MPPGENSSDSNVVPAADARVAGLDLSLSGGLQSPGLSRTQQDRNRRSCTGQQETVILGKRAEWTTVGIKEIDCESFASTACSVGNIDFGAQNSGATLAVPDLSQELSSLGKVQLKGSDVDSGAEETVLTVQVELSEPPPGACCFPRWWRGTRPERGNHRSQHRQSKD